MATQKNMVNGYKPRCDSCAKHYASCEPGKGDKCMGYKQIQKYNYVGGVSL